ncbi:hypothetical protein C0030_000285 [Candidatus Liberibacter solanacearum]|uniref:Lipoprotein n=1 Tax=Candidatus Liberibacter solanacearum TaxID=556287 RepID=A0A424FNW9_9HYPH|nr:hypothetical protein [Candidatus Liberibacter solanacearum]RPD37851.1 hypothetical protein C0030_000285 [Candidatus Liberibacter solanacearum]
MMDIKKLGLLSGVTMLSITAMLSGCDNAAKKAADTKQATEDAAKKAEQEKAEKDKNTSPTS